MHILSVAVVLHGHNLHICLLLFCAAHENSTTCRLNIYHTLPVGSYAMCCTHNYYCGFFMTKINKYKAAVLVISFTFWGNKWHRIKNRQSISASVLINEN